MRVCVLLGLGIALPAAAVGQSAAAPNYEQAITVAQQAVSACSARAAACVPAAAPPDALPGAGSTGSTPALRFGWLRATFGAARTATPEERARSMDGASTRLAGTLAQLHAPGEHGSDAHALALATAILQQHQFRFANSRPSRWQLLQAAFWRWVDRVLEGAAAAAEHRPWLGIVVEWTCLISALAGVLAYLLRVFRRERLRVELPWRGAALPAEQGGADWLALAHAAAAQARWRDAVHALYWATIHRVSASGRWRTGPERTPREYLRLLEPGSDAMRSLAALTTVLEHAWYANQPATEQEYLRAARCARELNLALGTHDRPAREGAL